MIELLERILVAVYRFFVKRKLYFYAWRKGFKITEFEWLPPKAEVERIVRITPNDGFDHTRDNCACNPTHRVDDIKGMEYNILQHRVMA